MWMIWRKSGDSVKIGDTVVRVISIDNGKCRLGVEAPRDVSLSPLDRHEEVEKQADRAGFK
jgi:carbon storage regulator CsrA